MWPIQLQLMGFPKVPPAAVAVCQLVVDAGVDGFIAKASINVMYLQSEWTGLIMAI